MEHLIFSFYLTYVLLLTTGTITLIEALRTKIPEVQHIMNLETCISFVAGYFYSVFNDKVKDPNIDLNEITQLRYIDWAITTPIMLLVLSLVLSFNSKTKIRLRWYIAIVFFNYLMLSFGYLGETGNMERNVSTILGSIALIITFGILFVQYLLPRFIFDNYIIFGVIFLIWSIYGIAYNFTELNKNITYNYLDLIAKCFIGVGLWIYYTKIIKYI